MTPLVRSTCPGCKKALHIPAEWLRQAIRCKHCGMVLQARSNASPAPRTSSTPLPPTKATLPPSVPKSAVTAAPVAQIVTAPPGRAAAAPMAVPVAAVADPFDNLRTSDDAAPARTPRRRKSGAWWKLPLFMVFLLAVGAGVVYFKWDSIAALIPADEDAAVAANTRDKEKAEKTVETPTRKPDSKRDTPQKPPKNRDKPPASKPSGPKNPPPPKDPSKPKPKPRDMPRPDPTPPRPSPRPGAEFPRRALIISVHDYLYANPLQNGTPGNNGHNLNRMFDALANGLRVPFPQIAHLSDDAGPKMGARAPTKGIIEETLTKFLDSSRPQDRILVFFVGHSVEMGDDVYLAPIEGELDKPATLIPLKWFYEQLAKCKARQKVLVLDVNRYNQTFGQERPGSEEMGEKLDALLKAPPEGVQVWSSCSPKQRSYASDEYPMGIFLDQLEVALQNGLQGKIQKEEEPLPLDFYVEKVNQMMKEDLSKRKLEQVSRLTGKVPDTGAAYDPKEASAPNAVTALARPPEGVELNKMLVETVLDQIGTPPVKVTHEMALRYDALPPFSVEALQQYQGDKANPDSPLRKAVVNARAVLWAIYPGAEPQKLQGEVSRLRGKINVQLTVMKDGYRAPNGGGNAETQFKNGVMNDERRVALLIRAIEDALEELTADPVKEARGSESKRWKANYDFILARMQMQYAYLFEYQSMLGSMRKEFPPRDPALQGGWKLASQPNLQGDGKGKKAAKEARKLLDKIIEANAGSPWEVLAKREKLTNLGLEWQATR